MDIYFSPVSSVVAVELSFSVEGSAIVINGAKHELSDLAAIDPSEGGQYPPFVCKADAESVTIALYYVGAGTQSVLFPDPLIDVQDGPVELPQ